MRTRRPHVFGSERIARLAGVSTSMIPQTRTHVNPDPDDGKLNAMTRLRAAILRATLKLRRKRGEEPPADAA
ncbi:MAG: hypothetical protein HY553_18495 [Elusimicrobia bacterium]|nr:hypothetical protein [Elusimicrobiota bacterium]